MHTLSGFSITESVIFNRSGFMNDSNKPLALITGASAGLGKPLPDNWLRADMT